LIDPDIIDQTVRFHIEGGWDYTSNTLRRTFPRGIDVEAFNSELLRDLESSHPNLSPSEREQTTLAVYTRVNEYKVGSYFADTDYSIHRWTLDTLEDYIFLQWLFNQAPSDSIIGYKQVLNFLNERPNMIRREEEST
jgi:spore coat polysaccharide biosynthesis protein SpsF